MDRANLFVIGVNKAETSWLYELLDHHPDVFMCEEKELFYFGSDYPEKMEEYHAHFPFEASYRYLADLGFACYEEALDEQVRKT